jgi:hypothetical protein
VLARVLPELPGGAPEGRHAHTRGLDTSLLSLGLGRAPTCRSA